MKTAPLETILAVVTLHRETVGGGAPIFYAKDEEEREKIALYLSRILDAMAHDLENGTYIIVKH
ncbi:MAG: hypothetical protein RDU89_00560 [bacterium]|nr:hypothetical protein [bacterium]